MRFTTQKLLSRPWDFNIAHLSQDGGTSSVHEPSNANHQSKYRGSRLTRILELEKKNLYYAKLALVGLWCPLLTQKSSTCANISQKLQQWDLQDPCKFMLLNILQQKQPIVCVFANCMLIFLGQIKPFQAIYLGRVIRYPTQDL